jgi:imidazolonepropionase-like amidohydrolase
LGWSAVDEGSAADLLAFDDDPRTNLDTLRNPKRIVLRGRVIA